MDARNGLNLRAINGSPLDFLNVPPYSLLSLKLSSAVTIGFLDSGFEVLLFPFVPAHPFQTSSSSSPISFVGFVAMSP